MKRISMTLIFTGLVLTSAYSQQTFGGGVGNLRLEIDPTNPDNRDSVTVTIAEEFGASCIGVCDVTGEWITPTEYHIDWFILDDSMNPKGGGEGCLAVILTSSSNVHLGRLDSGEYLVTATRHIAQWDEVCTEGVQPLETQTTFQVVPNIPTVSQWGLIILVLSLLATATILLRRRACLFILCCAIMIPSVAFAQPPHLSAPHHPERLLVRFKDKVSIATRKTVHARSGALHLKSYRHVKGLTLVKVPAARLQAALKSYQKNPNVLYAEPDYKIYLAGIPDDASFGLLWGMHNTGQVVNGVTGVVDADIDAPEAWDVWTGDQNFRIAVVDTGVNYFHADLEDNIWTNPVELIGDKNSDGCPGVCGVDDDESGNNVDIFQLHWIMEADRISGSCGVTHGIILMEGLS